MFWLKQVYYGLMGISLLALLYHFYKLDRSLRIFLPIIVLAILTQLAGDLLRVYGFDHFFVFHIYIPIEYGLLCLYFSSILESKLLKSIIVGSALMLNVYFILFYFLNPAAFYARSFADFVITSLLISIWTIAFFIELFHREGRIDLVRYPDFWINTGNLLFYAGCLFVMGFYFSIAEKDTSLAQKILYINYILNLILYILYSIAFACFRMKRIS